MGFQFLGGMRIKLAAVLAIVVLLVQPLGVSGSPILTSPLPDTSSILAAQPGTAFTPKGVKDYPADVPLAWYNLAYQLVKTGKTSPPLAARIFGYSGVALYEALVPGMPGYRSLAGQLNGLRALPPAVGKNYHWPIVANAALGTILSDLYKTAPKESRADILNLQRRIETQYAAKIPRQVLIDSTARGVLVGKWIADWSRSDGYTKYKGCAYTPPKGTGLWEPTPPSFAAALEACWGKMRPMMMPSSSTCRPAPPLAYSENPASAFYKDAKEVYIVTNHLTPAQKATALYWSDNAGETGTPPGHSISILSQVIVQQKANLAIAAEGYARVGIAVSDAFVSCWSTKFVYNVLRPVTYIRKVIDPNWMPPIATPPFPEYTSGHSVQSEAAAVVLTKLFGNIGFVDRTHADLGLAPRTYKSFQAFADEAAISRLYGGIHFRTAIARGLTEGKCVGTRVNALKFKIQ